MTRVSLGLAASLVVSLSSIASGQPTLVVTGTTPGALSGNGQSVASSIYDASIARYRVCRYTLGLGIEFAVDGYLSEGNVYTNHDGSVMVWPSANREGLGGFATDKITPHYLVEGGSIINIGTMDIGNECDSTLNYGNGLSSNGRYIVGACWTARLCGPFRAWIYDTSAGEYEILPFSIDANNRPARNTRADSVNADGTVVCGYDENFDGNRRATAWRKVGNTWTEQILDPVGGEAYAVSADGNVIVGRFNSETMQALYGTTTRTPIRWTWSGTEWVHQNLGGDESMLPVALNADGSTVVGGQGGGFIWRADINGGEAIGFDTYLASLGWSEPDITVGNPFGVSVYGISADGSSILAMFRDDRSACLPTWFNAIVNLNGSACEPVRINLDPQSQAILAPDQFFGDTFNVFASGTGPLNYQWQKEVTSGVWVNLVDDHCDGIFADEFDVKGSTTSQLRIGHLTNNFLGNYRCVVSNSCGSVTTRPAAIAYCTTPGIALQPADAIGVKGGSVSFEVAGSGGGIYGFQWRRNGVPLSDGPSGSGSVITGFDTQRLTISNISAADVASYDCVVTNPCQQVVSSGASLSLCAADFDGDGFVSGIDFDLYVGAFEGGDMASDFDGDGFITGIDFDLYVGAFELGC